MDSIELADYYGRELANLPFSPFSAANVGASQLTYSLLTRLLDEGDLREFQKQLLKSGLPLGFELRRTVYEHFFADFGLEPQGARSKQTLEACIEAEENSIDVREIAAYREKLGAEMVGILGLPAGVVKAKREYYIGEIIGFVTLSLKAIKTYQALERLRYDSHRIGRMNNAEWNSYKSKQGIKEQRKEMYQAFLADIAEKITQGINSSIYDAYGKNNAHDFMNQINESPFFAQMAPLYRLREPLTNVPYPMISRDNPELIKEIIHWVKLTRA